MASEDWGVPDWQDPEAYPKPNERTRNEWRWEFLRREPEYRRDWAKHYKQSYQYFLELSQDPGHLGFYGKKIFSPDDPCFRAYTSDSVEKYGLRGLPNPSISRLTGISFYRHLNIPTPFPGIACRHDESRAMYTVNPMDEEWDNYVEHLQGLYQDDDIVSDPFDNELPVLETGGGLCEVIFDL
jgi:hypothetical protein